MNAGMYFGMFVIIISIGVMIYSFAKKNAAASFGCIVGIFVGLFIFVCGSVYKPYNPEAAYKRIANDTNNTQKCCYFLNDGSVCGKPAVEGKIYCSSHL